VLLSIAGPGGDDRPRKRSTMTRIPEGATPRYTDRRWLIGDAPWQELPPSEGSRIRVLIDNDFSGDPDDLYQLVHHLLCPNVDIRAVIGSHLREGDAFDPSPHTASNACAVAADVFASSEERRVGSGGGRR